MISRIGERFHYQAVDYSLDHPAKKTSRSCACAFGSACLASDNVYPSQPRSQIAADALPSDAFLSLSCLAARLTFDHMKQTSYPCILQCRLV